MPSNKDRPAEAPEGGPSKKKVKFSSQVSVQEFHAHPAAETVVFHLLYSTSTAELEQEISAGGRPFHCEFYNQVSDSLRQHASSQQVHPCTLISKLFGTAAQLCTCYGNA
jgi:hypothetical protein